MDNHLKPIVFLQWSSMDTLNTDEGCSLKCTLQPYQCI